MKVTVALLAAFLVLIFWGVLAQANAESAGLPASVAIERFFDSYIILILGFIPLPAFKGLSVLASFHLICSMACRIPRGVKNAGLWVMHLALLVLLVGGVLGCELKREYYGYAESSRQASENMAENVRYFAAEDSLGRTPVIIENSWPYYVQYRGYVELPQGRSVAMYRAFYDPFHFVPYAFMVLFLLGAVYHYVVKIRCRRTMKVLPLIAFFLVSIPVSSRASENPIPVWEGLGPDTPVLVDSVVRPFDSFARGFLDDLYGRVTYGCREGEPCQGKVSAVEVIRMISLEPEKACNLSLFKIFRSDAAEALRLPTESRYLSYAQIVSSIDILRLYASREDDHPATLEMKRLYSNVLRYESVKDGLAISFVKKDEMAVNSGRLSIEVLYHRANFVLWAFIMAFVGCLLSALNMIFKSHMLDKVANAFCIIDSAVLVLIFAARAYITTRPPLSSLYEIVLLVALLLVAFESGAYVFCKKRTYTLMIPVVLMATVLLFFAKFVLEQGDSFQPIPAVLNSSVFLTMHVFTIALGYAGMILSGIVAHLALARRESASLQPLLFATLVFGAIFTIVGTLLGGVWADFAWGRFWGFDPKECGALFVILWAMLALHLRAGRLVKEHGFALINSFNVIVTFLCWFGVNLLGVGLHSYGFQSGSAVWLAAFTLLDLMAIAILAFRLRSR